MSALLNELQRFAIVKLQANHEPKIMLQPSRQFQADKSGMPIVPLVGLSLLSSIPSTIRWGQSCITCPSEHPAGFRWQALSTFLKVTASLILPFLFRTRARNPDFIGIVLCGSAAAGEYFRSKEGRFHDPEDATPIAARHVEICIILQKIATIVVACPREA